jgi:hypothetical protein
MIEFIIVVWFIFTPKKTHVRGGVRWGFVLPPLSDDVNEGSNMFEGADITNPQKQHTGREILIFLKFIYTIVRFYEVV